MNRWISRVAGVIAVVLIAGSIYGQGPKRFPTATIMAAATSKPQPEYPPLGRQLKLEAAVDVDITIDESGNVEKAETVKGNPIFAKAAETAAAKWKFTPFKDDGGSAVKVISTLKFMFKP